MEFENVNKTRGKMQVKYAIKMQIK